MCGATQVGQLGAQLVQGLSPRVRGNRNLDDGRHAPFGPIPACAGQPVGRNIDDLKEGAYPRVCGATKERVAETAGGKGLSPRVRGNPLQLDGADVLLGPIPACAGQPKRSKGRMKLDQAYPRVCGATIYGKAF